MVSVKKKNKEKKNEKVKIIQNKESINQDQIGFRVEEDPNFFMPYMKVGIKFLAKLSGKSLQHLMNELIRTKIVENFPIFGFTNSYKKELTMAFTEIFKIIAAQRKEKNHELDLNKCLSLKEYIFTKNSIKTEIFYLDIIHCYLASEFAFLEKLMDLKPHLNKDHKISLVDYYRSKFEKKSWKLHHNKILYMLFYACSSQLKENNVVGYNKENQTLNINIKMLEDFIFDILGKYIIPTSQVNKQMWKKDEKSILNKIKSGFTKVDFKIETDNCFNFVMSGFFNNKLPFYFKPFFSEIHNFKGYYEYLKENDCLKDFMISLMSLFHKNRMILNDLKKRRQI